MMRYAVKVNSFVKDIVIHKHPCGHIRKRGGAPGKYDQVSWEDFDTLDAAEEHAKTWESRGYIRKHCRFCLKI
jgi:hypothetical protein